MVPIRNRLETSPEQTHVGSLPGLRIGSLLKSVGHKLIRSPPLTNWVKCVYNNSLNTDVVVAYSVVTRLCRFVVGQTDQIFKAFLFRQEQDEQRWLSFYFFIRTGDGSGTFPESVRTGRAQRFIHHRSRLHRLFILPRGRPTSEARPIKSSHSCPSVCHLARINKNTLSFSLFLIFPLFSIYLYF